MAIEGHYYQTLLDDAGVDLKQPIQIEKNTTLDIDPKAFESFTEKYRSEALMYK